MTDRSRPSPSVSLLLSAVVALCVCVAWNVLGARGEPPAEPATVQGADSVADRTALERRIEALEQKLLQARAADSIVTPVVDRIEVSDAEAAGREPVPEDVLAAIQQLDARLARLEAFQNALDEDEARRRVERLREQAERERRDAERQQAIANAPHVILDPNQPDLAKAEAWQVLRRADASTWTDAVVSEITRVARTSSDPAVRADIWRCADADRAHRLLRQPLLDAVLRDPHQKVREEAAETLENYLDDPAVVAILEGVMQSDASESVRDEARRALGRRR